MSKKHFVTLANVIRASVGTPEEFSQRQIQLLGMFCGCQNDRFNLNRWLGYIAGTNGVNGGPIKKEKAEQFGTQNGRPTLIIG